MIKDKLLKRVVKKKETTLKSYYMLYLLLLCDLNLWLRTTRTLPVSASELAAVFTQSPSEEGASFTESQTTEGHCDGVCWYLLTFDL